MAILVYHMSDSREIIIKNYTLGSYILSRKNLMFGALGNTWRYNFYMGMHSSMTLEK